MVKEKEFSLSSYHTYLLTPGNYGVTVAYARLKLRWSQRTNTVYTALEIDFESGDGGQAKLFTPVKKDWSRVFAALGDLEKWGQHVPPRRLRALVGAEATILVVQSGPYTNVKAIGKENF